MTDTLYETLQNAGIINNNDTVIVYEAQNRKMNVTLMLNPTFPPPILELTKAEMVKIYNSINIMDNYLTVLYYNDKFVIIKDQHNHKKIPPIDEDEINNMNTIFKFS